MGDFAAAEQDATRTAIQRLRDELDLQIKDANYEDRVFYKNLYDQLTAEHSTIFTKYNNLKWEYSLLKKSYNTVITQRDEYMAERIKIREAIDECHTAINRLQPDSAPTESDPSEVN